MWEDKLHVLRREIHFRRRYDPDRVAKGRLSPADAKAQLERLEAVQDKYWAQLFTWTSPAGHACGSAGWRAEVREHLRLIELARAPLCSPARAEGEGGGQEHEPALSLVEGALPV